MSFAVDVHHHILPDVFRRATNDAHSPVGGILPAPWSKESALSYVDDAGIDVAITSISTPGVHMGDDSAARDLARRVNELSAALSRSVPAGRSRNALTTSSAAASARQCVADSSAFGHFAHSAVRQSWPFRSGMAMRCGS